MGERLLAENHQQPPLPVVDAERAAAQWALFDPAAAALTRVTTVHAGSASGALARLVGENPARQDGLAATVAFVVHCHRDSTTRRRLQIAYVVGGVTAGRFQLTHLL